MIRYISAITILSLFTLTSLHAGGPWPQPKGNGYFKLYQWWIVSDQHFTDAGLLDPNVTQGVFNTSLYGEFGFTDRLTGILNFPMFSRAYFNNTISGTTGEVIDPGEGINSIGDTDLGLQYGLLVNGPFVLSARVMFGLPLGNNGGGSSGALQTGDGEFNQILRVDAGTSFRIGKTNAYAAAFLGVNNRSNGFSDEFRFGVEAGATVLQDKLTLIARLHGIESFQNGDPEKGANSTSIFANNSEILSFSPEIAYHINEKWGFSVGTGIALSGKIIFAAPSYSAGIFFKL